MDELRRMDSAAATGLAILAHLGSGASLDARHRGKSVRTKMGLTPTSGLVMSPARGDVDSGLVHYLAPATHVTSAQSQRMVTHESGLLGVTGRSAELRELLAGEGCEDRSADALSLFFVQA